MASPAIGTALMGLEQSQAMMNAAAATVASNRDVLTGLLDSQVAAQAFTANVAVVRTLLETEGQMIDVFA